MLMKSDENFSLDARAYWHWRHTASNDRGAENISFNNHTKIWSKVRRKDNSESIDDGKFLFEINVQIMQQ